VSPLRAAIRDGLAVLRAELAQAIVDVRGRGLLWGIDIVSKELAGEVLLNLAEEGLLISPCFTRPETLRLLPPLVASDDDVAVALRALDRAIRCGLTTVGSTVDTAPGPVR